MVAAVRQSLIYWDGQRYLFESGEPVPEQSVRQLIELSREGLSRRLEAATERYLAGEITIEDWQYILAQELKDEYFLMAAFALGGIAAIQGSLIAPTLLAMVGTALRSSVRGIETVAKKVDRLSPPQLREYVRYKARSVRPVFEQSKQLLNQSLGFNEGIRLLDPSAKHCPSCPGYQRTEWVPISEIVPVGVACECGGRCRCSVRYRFNPQRALAELTGTESLVDRLAATRENQQRAMDEYAQRLSARKAQK